MNLLNSSEIWETLPKRGRLSKVVPTLEVDSDNSLVLFFYFLYLIFEQIYVYKKIRIEYRLSILWNYK